MQNDYVVTMRTEDGSYRVAFTLVVPALQCYFEACKVPGTYTVSLFKNGKRELHWEGI